MSRTAFLLALGLMLAASTALAQQQKVRKPVPKPSLQGWLVLPIPIANDIFQDVTDAVGQLDFKFQVPVVKQGWGLGVGAKGSLFDLRENALAPANIAGDVRRWTFYGQVQYEHYTGPITYYQFAAQMGNSNYSWTCANCAGPKTQKDLFWGANVSYFVHASDNLAFGLLLGYEHDGARMTPDLLCLDSYPGRSDTGPSAPYQYITIGLGFSTRFTRTQEGPNW